MSPAKKKTPVKSELFWDRFEKSGSIQAYLRFHQARQVESKDKPVAKKPATKTR